MNNFTKNKLCTFEIGYKGHCHEFSEHYTEHVRAKNRSGAWGVFCRRHRIKESPFREQMEVQWWDNDWLMAFRYVKKVTSKTCPQCRGTGTLFC